MEIDVERVTAVAVGFEHSAEVIGGVAESCAGLQFGPEVAGRNYRDAGERVSAALDGLAAGLRRWGDATKDNSARLRASVDEYRTTDVGAAHALADSAGGR